MMLDFLMYEINSYVSYYICFGALSTYSQWIRDPLYTVFFSENSL